MGTNRWLNPAAMPHGAVPVERLAIAVKFARHALAVDRGDCAPCSYRIAA
jgi:hypothetical protein